jgi:hypothetical protein
MYHQNSENNSSYDSSRKDQKHLVHQHCLRVEFLVAQLQELETQIMPRRFIFVEKKAKCTPTKYNLETNSSQPLFRRLGGGSSKNVNVLQ